MAYKRKTHKETVPMPQESTDPGKVAVTARIMEDPKFAEEWRKYARDMSNIPAMLGDILKELVAIRLLMEENDETEKGK